MLTPPNDGDPLTYALTFTFRATNNDVEYDTLITSLRIATGVGVVSLKVRCNYQLVVNHVKVEYATRGEQMKIRLWETKALVQSFQLF